MSAFKVFLLLLLSRCSPASRTHSIRYVGCYNDANPNRDLFGLAGVTQLNGVDVHPTAYCFVLGLSMTLEKCSSLCSLGGFAYMGAQDGKECYCGWSYGKHGPAVAGACSSNCLGNASQKCGGNYVNSVYEMRYTYSDLFKASSRSSMSAPSSFSTYRRVGAAVAVKCLLQCDSACQAVIFSPSQRQCSLMKFALVPTELSGVEGDFFTRF